MLAEFHFLRPWWLIALLPLAVLLFWQIRHRISASAWQAVVDPQLLSWLAGQSEAQNKRGRWLTVLLGVSGLLAIMALAGPAWERQPQPVVRATQARVIALDLSRSMLATDQKPSRLEQARFKLEDILNRSREGQTGLVAYAGEAFVISPLTDDSRTIQALLPALAPNIMPVQGARADLALQKAADLLNQAGIVNGEILLITDGVNLDRTQAVVESLRSNGITTTVLAIGTEQGAPIPLPEGGFMLDRQGDIVIPQLQPQALQALARVGGGRYSLLTIDTRDLDYLLPEQSPAATEQRDRRDDEVESGSELWKEQGPWLVLLLLPLCALSFRRGWLFCWCLLIPGLMLHPGSIQAAEEEVATESASWWKTPAQQTRDALDNREYELAGQWVDRLSDQPLLLGEALYRNGDYEAAAEAFAQAGNAQGSYNRGNALAQAGDIEQAIEAYEQALQQDPNLQDAKDNLELLKNLQQQQEQQQQQQQNQDSDQQQDQQQDNEQQQQQEQQDQQSGEQQEGEQQDGQQQEQGQQQQQEQQQEQQGEQSDQQESEQQDNEQQQAEAQEQLEDAEQSEQQVQQQSAELSELDEEQQRALEQWLRRIPDDPGTLLRNKFRYQYQRQQLQGNNDSDEDDW